MTTDKKSIIESIPQKGFFGHPKGLFTLFLLQNESNFALLYVL